VLSSSRIHIGSEDGAIRRGVRAEDVHAHVRAEDIHTHSALKTEHTHTYIGLKTKNCTHVYTCVYKCTCKQAREMVPSDEARVLKMQVEMLSAENKELKKESQHLKKESQELKKQSQDLQKENQELKGENQELKMRGLGQVEILKRQLYSHVMGVSSGKLVFENLYENASARMAGPCGNLQRPDV